jgi:hypothetical protein
MFVLCSFMDHAPVFPSPDCPSAPAPDEDPLDFVPVRHERQRFGGWTPEAQRAFVLALSRCGLVAAAARSVGRTARTAYRLRQRADAADFCRAWDIAVEVGRGRAMDAAMMRAFTPRVVDVRYRDRIVGQRVFQDGALLTRALRAIEADATGTPPHRARLRAGYGRTADR